jgi:glycerol-3-phosphate O-acyltransferase/dihydroxyacetone phosphate acyltransferase
MLYAILRRVAHVALRWFYRDIAIQDAHRIPAHGPVILAANHNNALVDALIVACVIDREVRLTAKATLLDHPLTRVVVHAVGIVPLRRAVDETKAGATAPKATRNQGAFEAIVQNLAAGGVILIFPEGISHSGPALAPLKTGCARMAIQAVEQGVAGLSIVPVGLTFEDKGRPRSRVAVLIGEPIPVTRELAMTREPVAALTATLDAGLRDVTLNVPSHDDAAVVRDVSDTLSRAFEDVRSLDEPQPSFAGTIRLAQQVERVRHRLPTLAPLEASRVRQFVDDLNRWKAEARRLDTPIDDVGMPLSAGAGTWFVVREALIAAVVGPGALWGRLNHAVPLRLAVWVGRRTSRNPDEPAMHTLVGGLGLVLATYAFVTTMIVSRFGWRWGMAYLASLPVAASIDFWWRDRLQAAWRRARGYIRLRSHPERASWLAAERDRLRAEAAAIGAFMNR